VKKTPPVVTGCVETGRGTSLIRGIFSGLPFFDRHTGGGW
jgi:hypothetical protein